MKINYENLTHIFDIIALPVWLLGIYYFYDKEEELTLIEKILYLCLIIGFIVDFSLTFIYLIKK